MEITLRPGVGAAPGLEADENKPIRGVAAAEDVELVLQPGPRLAGILALGVAEWSSLRPGKKFLGVVGFLSRPSKGEVLVSASSSPEDDGSSMSWPVYR